MRETAGADAQTVRVDLGPRSYDIVVERGLLSRAGEEIARRVAGGDAGGRLAFIVTQPRIGRLYGLALAQGLERAGFRVQTVTLAAGERFKTLGAVQRVYTAMLAASADRRSVVVALGGGVIGDLAGFAAATYNRGVDFVQVPTTLLAQVDSSVGGKTGVNFGPGKNLLGAFYQPRFVAIDPDTLASLPVRERRSGLAEVLKYGIIDDKSFFRAVAPEADALLRLQSASLEQIIARSCQIKARVVEQDEHEGGLRAILNFGHTIGHALEGATQYRVYTHGEAIALGMVSAALLGEEIGITRTEDTAELTNALQACGFAVRLPETLAVEKIMSLLSLDKKSVGGQARFVLMHAIGRVSSGHCVPLDMVERALRRQQAGHDG